MYKSLRKGMVSMKLGLLIVNDIPIYYKFEENFVWKG